MARYKVAQVGCGGRGKVHIDAFLKNADRFDLAAVCDLDAERLRAAAEKFDIAKTYTDAEEMLAAERPDVFCFVTQPHVRLEMVELGVRHGVKAIAFEKPMATSLADARRILDLCREAGFKAIVSHQQKYGRHWHEAKATIEAGEIGEVVRLHACARGWLLQLGTHIVDYVIWMLGGPRANWVVGHAQGRKLLADSHPSPEYVCGQIAFENGLRAFVECGALSPQRLDDDHFWVDNHITIYGTHGYAWANTDGEWRALTKSSAPLVVGEQLETWPVQNDKLLQPPYISDLADWLDDDARVHPCNLDVSYHGFEICEGLCLSALEHRKVDLPLSELPAEPILERLERELP